MKIIGVAGEINAGKDLVAKMINYILSTGITTAKYEEFVKLSKIDEDELNKLTRATISFADPLKKVLSIMYGIPLKRFYDRKYKDDMVYSFTERRFIEPKDLTSDYGIITIETLEQYSLNELIHDSVPNVCIKLRTLMQYFGTNIGRKYMDDNIWINSTMANAALISELCGFCVIADVRFDNEAAAILNSSLYGGLIKVIRKDNIVNTNSNHVSENINFDAPYIIENNSSKLSLFYKVIDVLQKIYNR